MFTRSGSRSGVWFGGQGRGSMSGGVVKVWGLGSDGRLGLVGEGRLE